MKLVSMYTRLKNAAVVRLSKAEGHDNESEDWRGYPSPLDSENVLPTAPRA